jgi:membrane-bound lytic murein transglycosylase D
LEFIVHIHFIRALSITTLAFIISGCGAQLAGTHSFQRTPRQQDSTLADITPDISFEEEIDVTIADEPMLDSVMLLISRAGLACESDSFDQADLLLRSACHLIDSLAPAANQIENLYDDIALRYVTQLPPRYSDNVPEQISALVFRHQLSYSLDSLTDEIDTSLFPLNCLQGAPYNIPISKHSRVQKALTLTLKHRTGYIERSLNRGSRYFSFMKKVFADSGLPTDLVYLPIIESGFNYRAYSPAHAAGVWQFIPSTGRIYDLRSNYWLDERRDPIKSTFAAVRYLKKLHGDFNDWYLALAAYNCGEGRVGRTIKKAGTADYWQLKLPRETMNYVPHYLASMMVAKNPSCFGLDIAARPPNSPEVDTVLISDCIDMQKIADGVSVPLDTLKFLNPHILHWCTPPEMSDITLYLPPGKAPSFRSFYETLGNDDKVSWYRYRIQRGDNLSTIAERFKLSVYALRSVNKLHSNRIIAGRHLFIPIPVSKGTQTVAYKAAEKKSSPKKSSAPIPVGSKKIVYRLKKGDTMYSIAKSHNVSVAQISGWNDIAHPEKMSVGQSLVLYSTGQPEDTQKTEKKAIPENATKKQYRVTSGDNLYTVSKTLDVAVADLAAWNDKDLDAPLIHPGEHLTYYALKAPEPQKRSPAVSVQQRGKPECDNCVMYKIAAGDNLYRLSQLFKIDMEEIMVCNDLHKDAVLRVGDILRIPSRDMAQTITKREDKHKLVYYTVQKGDNLWRIARLFEVPVKHLYEANDMSPDTVLMPGDTLRVVLAEDL